MSVYYQPVNSWTNEQIIRFSRWLDKCRPTYFFTTDKIQKRLTALNIPFSFLRGVKWKGDKKRITLCLAIGTPEHRVILKLRNVVLTDSYGYPGVWTHQLLLAIFVYLGLIIKPKIPADPGAKATFYFCLDLWKRFLDEKIRTQATSSEGQVTPGP